MTQNLTWKPLGLNLTSTRFKHVNIQQLPPWTFNQFNTQCFAVPLISEANQMPISIDKWCSGGSAAGEMLVKGKLPPPACKMTDDTGGCTPTAFKLPLCFEGLRPGNRKLFSALVKKKTKPKWKSKGRLFLGLVSVTQNFPCGRRQDRACASFLAYRKTRWQKQTGLSTTWKKEHQMLLGWAGNILH